MDTISLIDALPIDLLYVVSNYDPAVVFLKNYPLGKYDWFKLVRLNFGFVFERDLCTNEEMMNVYVENCFRDRSQIVSGGQCHVVIRLPGGRLMSSGNNEFGQLGLGDNDHRNFFSEIGGITGDVVDVVCGRFYTVVRLKERDILRCE